MTRLAIAASAEFPDLRPDWPLLRDALGDLGVTASTAVWTDPNIDWDSYDLVVANGAWDNIHHPDAFLDWVDSVAARTTVVNSPGTLRWNMDKHYLADLAAAGVPTVPTTWLTPDVDGSTPDFPDREFVIKPTVSGGGFETARYLPTEQVEARAHVDRLRAAGRAVMVQPYQPMVDTQGELGLIFVGGRYSHTIHKGPLLRSGAGPQASLWENQVITAAEPHEAHLRVATQAIEAAEAQHGTPTYARVDLVPLADHSPAVLELELLDPALFFEFFPAEVPRFARVLHQAMS